jgi:hypothetical protein
MRAVRKATEITAAAAAAAPTERRPALAWRANRPSEASSDQINRIRVIGKFATVTGKMRPALPYSSFIRATWAHSSNTLK